MEQDTDDTLKQKSPEEFQSGGENQAKSPEAVVDRLKWQAALAYLPLICLIPMFLNRDNPYLRRHAKQGFILFAAELLALLLKIDAIWNLIILLCLVTAFIGAMGVFLRGDIKIPYLSDLADRINL